MFDREKSDEAASEKAMSDTALNNAGMRKVKAEEDRLAPGALPTSPGIDALGDESGLGGEVSGSAGLGGATTGSGPGGAASTERTIHGIDADSLGISKPEGAPEPDLATRSGSAVPTTPTTGSKSSKPAPGGVSGARH